MSTRLPDPPAPPSTSASLDPSETSQPTRWPVTASQRRLHSRWMRDRETILDALSHSRSPALVRRVQRMESCCAVPLVVQASGGAIRLRLCSCRDRMCPRCQTARGKACTLAVTRAVRRIDAPRFVTLTLRHRQASLVQELDRLARHWRELRKSALWKRHVRGGVYAIEVTRNTSRHTWHVHLHVIVEGTFLPQKQLASAWGTITGGSTIVDVRAVHDRGAVAKYVAAYISKPADVGRWDHADIREYAEAMAGRRLLHTFGTLHNAEPREEQEPEQLEPRAPDVVLGSLPMLVDAVQCNVHNAGRALHLLSRISPLWRAAIGAPDTTTDTTCSELEPDDVALVVQVFAYMTMPTEAPTPEPRRKRATGPPQQLWAPDTRYR